MKKEINKNNAKNLNNAMRFKTHIKINGINSFAQAMDGNLETWFQKSKETDGWVGLDLGKK